MKGNKRADTKPETQLRSLLHANGLRFRKDFRIDLVGRVVRPDVVFTRRKVAVFVDGCFWHLCPDHGRVPGGKNADYWQSKLTRNVARDGADTRAMVDSGWTVLRIGEHEPVDLAVARVLDTLG
jgi:DNA mismatch endonuclease, patch repair protein